MPRYTLCTLESARWNLHFGDSANSVLRCKRSLDFISHAVRKQPCVYGMYLPDQDLWYPGADTYYRLKADAPGMRVVDPGAC